MMGEPLRVTDIARYPFLIVDVFTDRPLAGNQLAVFTEGENVADDLMQSLALEVGFAETVFLFPQATPGTARIRIFMPSREIPFAGHPVLGTAVAIGLRDHLDSVVLTTGRGEVALSISRHDERHGSGTMTQPLPAVRPYDQGAELLNAVGLERSRLPVELYDNGLEHVYLIGDDVDQIARLRPDFSALERIAGPIGVNCTAGEGDSWTTRVFLPASGITEDAATGSAAGPLAVHLARHDQIEFGQRLTISQGAQIGRPSTLYATAFGSKTEIARVEVAGDAVIVGSGEFEL
jgi:trans-2,3-dihydro-3-hydroxyanthranilate isomerase